jgi:hypothetical protein
VLFFTSGLLLPPFHWAVIEYDTVIEGSPRVIAERLWLVQRERASPQGSGNGIFGWLWEAVWLETPSPEQVNRGLLLDDEGETTEPSHRNKRQFRQGNFRP